MQGEDTGLSDWKQLARWMKRFMPKQERRFLQVDHHTDAGDETVILSRAPSNFKPTTITLVYDESDSENEGESSDLPTIKVSKTPHKEKVERPKNAKEPIKKTPLASRLTPDQMKEGFFNDFKTIVKSPRLFRATVSGALPQKTIKKRR